MMRVQPSRYVPIAVIAVSVIVTIGCGEPQVRGCYIDDLSNSLYDLQTDMVIPSDCPVSLGAIGEWKYTGAYVNDPNYYMEYGQVTVLNAGNALVGQSLTAYQSDPFDGWSAVIETTYPAATAYQGYMPNYGQTLTGDADDYGRFESGP